MTDEQAVYFVAARLATSPGYRRGAGAVEAALDLRAEVRRALAARVAGEAEERQAQADRYLEDTPAVDVGPAFKARATEFD